MCGPRACFGMSFAQHCCNRGARRVLGSLRMRYIACRTRVIAVFVASTIGLALFGLLGAALGGARVLVGAVRVVIGGWMAMAATYGIGYAFGVSGLA